VGYALEKEKSMICSICRQGETNPGTTTVTLERGELTFVAKDVPSRTIVNCVTLLSPN
jgi:hypothetical protein